MNQSNQPLVSVVIPCYNHENFVQDSIQSVIDQTYQNIELIIIDDGSKDGSVEKIQEMIPACQERFVRFEFRYRPNKGLSATLNEALEWCEGEFFSPQASDDISLPDKLLKMIDVLLEQEENIAGVFAGVRAITVDKSDLYEFGDEKLIEFENVILRNTSLPGQIVVLKTHILRKVGGYDETKKIEDLPLFLKITSLGYNLYSISDSLLLYRKHDLSTSNRADFMLQGILEVLSEYQDNRLYKKAVSNSYMIEVETVIKTDRKTGLVWLMKSISYYPLNLFTKKFIRVSLLVFLPLQVLKFLKGKR